MLSTFLPMALALVSQTPHQEAAGDEVWNLERMREVARQIQGEIEDLRGLEFESPVRIELADRASFLAYAQAALEADGGEERLRREEEVAKLLGLVPGDLDLVGLTAAVLVEQVGGFYDPATETFYVMDSVQPDLARIVIAHEFTHALDDQHFDLGGNRMRLAGDADAAMAYHAVVEGSGMELMFEWARRHMDTEALARVASAQKELPTDLVSQAPPAVWKPLVALYYQGQAFLRRQKRPSPLGSPARIGDVDRALLNPPRSTEQVIHPLKYWNPDHLDEPRALTVDVENLPEEVTLLHQSTLGELHAAMVTTPYDERGGLDVSFGGVLGLRFTNTAATGWGGDRYALLGAGDGRLLIWATRWDSVQDADEFAAALSDVSDGINEAKATAPDHDSDLCGIRITRQEGDGVEVISWTGMSMDEAFSLTQLVRFEEV